MGLATFYDVYGGLTHALVVIEGSNVSPRYWLYCAPPLSRTPRDEAHADGVLRDDTPITCFWCLCRQRCR